MPKFYAFAGIPTAGKTTLIQSMLQSGKLPSNAYLHNVDDWLINLPAYQQALKALGLQEAFNLHADKACKVAELDLEQVIKEANKDIIYDRSCAMPDSLEFLQGIAANPNYDLNIYFLECDLETAYTRAERRLKEQSLYTSKEQLIAKSENLTKLKPEYIKIAASSMHIFDSSNMPIREIKRY